ncbi:MAG: NAD(+)/NADH kinase [Planctomycetota bacterium]|nr:NAD(+)/NADH kinase [Planctomycetota bacterium]MDA0932268.1 NAD(+)/NADH kinase [Planctomycetota bacterium]MDA1221541.1 NAD(+)/NADH kinase [Planctomycetota bacterium]
MRRVLIVGDERKGKVAQLVAPVAEQLRGDGNEVEVEFRRDVSLEGRTEVDLVVVFGGDGSILGAARRMGATQLPTLGINLGRLGFLTAFSPEDALEGIRAALRGELVEEPRMMLAASVERVSGESTAPVPFLNDAVLVREPSAGMVTIHASRVDRDLAVYTGDGLVVATPSGSTAYSLAAGGPVMSPRLEAMVLTPLAPHTLTLRPLVLPVGGGLSLVVRETGGEGPCVLTVDGQIPIEVRAGDRVHITPTDVRFRQLTHGPGSFFRTLREKFGWADMPRRAPG